MKQPDWQIDNFMQMKIMRWFIGGTGLFLAFLIAYSGFNESYTTIFLVSYTFGMMALGVFKPELVRVKLEGEEVKIFRESLYTGKAKSRTYPLSLIKSLRLIRLNDPYRTEAIIEYETERGFIEEATLPIKFFSLKKREKIVAKLRELQAEIIQD